MVQCRRSTVNCQRWYNVGKQLTQPYSDCGKSNFPVVDLWGVASVYSAPVVDCKTPAFVQRWVYNWPNLISTVEKVIFRQWMYKVHPVSGTLVHSKKCLLIRFIFFSARNYCFLYEKGFHFKTKGNTLTVKGYGIWNDIHLTAKGFPLMTILNRKSFNNEGNRLTVNILFLKCSLLLKMSLTVKHGLNDKSI